MTTPHRTVARVLSSPIDVIDWDTALSRVAEWADRRESRYVCFCNVHSVVTADSDLVFSQVIARSDMALPDGAPVAWMLRKQGFAGQERINGPDFMWRYLAQASERQESVYLYGSSARTVETLAKKLRVAFPGLVIAGYSCPPYRALTLEEDRDIIDKINASGAQTLWVSLGCPKQEGWMASHRGEIRAVMLGVGAAFNYHSGQIKRPPQWMQRYGLEWLGRLAANPILLLRRYLSTNTWFVLAAAAQLWRARPSR
ncbi:WecB/TagA/CpsF family glycosyltransferase [Candidatus Symbiobacter mobilis]|uniref:UDP-N-acetyl-D-mannosaminuronic acid transferase n=1 Tax=Candidatus Symbiobacter mobilis CR TaxID=946483 RepID=U5NB34_9BURK|nr:WecB/TagA/CpsF family glycosyltransferase [Candidatus Symbiobacter mobilis]AGX87443.1 UDP-N-acetyl-D-mannosaminuronic acid transferase [Candidatus Symbiobacter mobilis CR]